MKLNTVLRAALLPLVAGAFALTAPAATAAPAPPQDPGGAAPMIVGGERATENYPWMASLQVNGRHGCGGSLIAPQWVVTAAHCIAGQGMTLRIGSGSRSSGGTVVSSARTIRHPNYSGQAGPYDIALIQLSQSVSNQVVPVATGSPAQGTKVRLLGWGQTCPQRGCDQGPDYLKQLNTRINPDRMCTAGFDPSTELCVWGDTSQTACYGDSGGPLLVQGTGGWQLAGATSRAGANGTTCGTGEATIYTDVTAHRQWLDSTMGGGGPGCSVAEWSPAQYYPPYSTVSYQGYVWRNYYASQGEAPGSSWNWQRIGQC